MAAKDYIDPKGYWIDPARNVRRMGAEDGEQHLILKATETCSEELLYKAIVACVSAKQ